MEFSPNTDKALAALGSAGAFLTVTDGERANTMTIGWGYIGVMWGKTPYFMVMVRKSRHTFDIINNSDNFTVSIPFGGLIDELVVCGTKSGRDMDKSQVVSFVPAKKVATPVVDGCQMYYECKINYRQVLDKDAMPSELREKWYGDEDYHTLYYGEILDCYEK